MCAAEHTPPDTSRVLERRHSLAGIFERGGVVHEERHRIIYPQAVYRICLHFTAADDAAILRGGLCCAGFMTIFNLALMNDAVGGSASTAWRLTPSTRRAQVETFVKWIPTPLPTPTTRSDTQKLVRELSRSCSLGSELSISGRKPGRFCAAAKRLSTVDSDPSGSRKED